MVEQTMLSLKAVLGKLSNVNRCGEGWSARCPVHNDEKPSLTVTEDSDGTVLLHCHAGCSYEVSVVL
jgi:DNA primase (bacterial type)